MAPYFMNIASDEALATLYINFGKDVLKEKMGWNSVVILAEDTAFGQAITGLVTEALAPVAGIEVKEIITYDIGTNDFAPIFSKAAGKRRGLHLSGEFRQQPGDVLAICEAAGADADDRRERVGAGYGILGRHRRCRRRHLDAFATARRSASNSTRSVQISSSAIRKSMTAARRCRISTASTPITA